MFEIIGLLFATGLLFAVAAIVGAIFVAFARLIVPKEVPNRPLNLFSSITPEPRRPGVAFAFFIPILFAVYLCFCVAMLPGISAFNDIDQPLPNGAALTALGKMPEYGEINPIQNSVDQLAVNGPLVATRTCQTCGSDATNAPAAPFQLLDTRTRQVTPFADFSALERAFGKPLTLIPTEDFQSDAPAYQRQQRLNRWIIFTPPILLTCLYFAFLLYRRFASDAHPTHLA